MTIDEQLRQVVGAVLKVDPGTLGPQSSMDTIESWDSLQHMILMVALEEEFGVSIPEDVAAEATSFAAIMEALENVAPPRATR